MKIAFVGNPASVHVQRWVAEFIRRGHECRVFVVDQVQACEFETVLLDGAGRGGLLGITERVRDLRRKLREFDPDVLHAHYALDYGTWAALSGFHPFILTLWGSDVLLAPGLSWLSRWKVKRALASADLITGDSADLLSAAESLARVPADRLVRLVMGVDTECLQPVAEPLQNPEPIILSTRRLEPLYRHDDLLRAASLLASDCIPFQLVVSSYGTAEEQLRALSKDLGLEARVTFTGRLAEEELLALYHRADIYVTVPETDGTSVSLLEAMACGLPVVASDLPSNREWLVSDQLVPVGRPEVLAASLRSLIEDQESRRAIGIRNRRVVVESGNWRSEMDRMERLYETLRGARP
jgi:glycosyltransferase involved in cell wall biosynthesis